MTQPIWKDSPAEDQIYPFSSREDCLTLLQRAPEFMLDIGCGAGGVAHWIKQRHPKCKGWGCEINPSAGKLAEKYYERVIVGNIEEIDISTLAPSRPFDLVCLFDVLEHFNHPWRFLERLRQLTSIDAQIIVSLPNASNLLLLYDAYRGYWRYRKNGLLDVTHLRFFTDFDARKMFYQTGYRVVSTRCNQFGEAGDIFERHKGDNFPSTLSLGDFSVTVRSTDDLSRLCAQQNIYLLEPADAASLTPAEIEMASGHYPPTHAFGFE